MNHSAHPSVSDTSDVRRPLDAAEVELGAVWQLEQTEHVLARKDQGGFAADLQYVGVAHSLHEHVVRGPLGICQGEVRLDQSVLCTCGASAMVIGAATLADALSMRAH